VGTAAKSKFESEFVLDQGFEQALARPALLVRLLAKIRGHSLDRRDAQLSEH
jgi:hypothetical protein